MAEENDVESNRNYKLYFMKSIQTGDIKEDGIKRIRSSFLKKLFRDKMELQGN